MSERPATLIAASILGCITACSPAPEAKPDYAKIRAHLVKQLTDDQIRKLHAEAQREFAAELERARKEGEAFWKRREEIALKCSADIAYRTRNTGECSSTLPIGFESIGKPMQGRHSVEAIFEMKLYGMCAYAMTVSEAKKMKCLPE